MLVDSNELQLLFDAKNPGAERPIDAATYERGRRPKLRVQVRSVRGLVNTLNGQVVIDDDSPRHASLSKLNDLWRAGIAASRGPGSPL